MHVAACTVFIIEVILKDTLLPIDINRLRGKSKIVQWKLLID